VKRQVQSYLASIEGEFEGRKLLVAGEYDPQTYDDSRPIEYSRETTQVVDGQARVSAVIDRPLNFITPWAFSDMYNVHALAPEGFEPKGNCCVHQLGLLVRKRGKPLWTRGEIEAQFDEICSALYSDSDSPYIDPEIGLALDWRRVGVTAKMVVELCRRAGIAVYVLWNDTVVESYTPARRNEHLTTQALHIRGDHAYFYADAKTKQWIARQAKSMPASRVEETMQIAPTPADTEMSEWTELRDASSLKTASGHTSTWSVRPRSSSFARSYTPCVCVRR
jgi:hypothetical protein